MKIALCGVLVGAALVLSAFSGAAQGAPNLIATVRTGNAAAVAALLAKGADANQRGPEDITPLLVAASMGNAPIARALLAKGAKVDVQDSSSWQLSPLMVAAFAGRLEVMKVLLDRSANVELKNKDGNTALFFASQARESQPGVDLLIQRGAQKLAPKSGMAAFMQVGGLPLNTRCFVHIEGSRCDNANAGSSR